MTASVVVPLHPEMEVTEVDVNSIKTKFRLRNHDDQKIKEISESIKICGLINPITVDSDLYLLAGYHRWKAYELLGFSTIPAVIKDTTELRGELIEVEENLARNELNHIEVADHINRREEILNQLGMRMQNGGNQYSKGMLTTSDLAKQVGLTARTYRLKREPANIIDEVKDQIKETKFADNLLDMVKLSQQDDEVQRKVCNLLITGKCTSFKRALTLASLENWQEVRGDRGVDFDVKGRWGIPQSIMSFKKANVHLQDLVDLVQKDTDVYIKKRDLHFGGSEVPNYMMMADHSEFLVTYYTKENDLILENLMGRGTNVLAALYHGRRVVGFDINSNNVKKLREVCTEYFPDKHHMFDLRHSDGTELTEFKDQTEVFDACILDPPYTGKAEKYGSDPRDIGQMDYQEYLKKLDTMMNNLSRLIKKSDFDQKVFKPIIIKCGSARFGTEGIRDLDFELQLLARKYNLVLWDKMMNKLENVWGNLCAVRNYKHGYVNKNMETNLTFVRF